jgi:uncharacterized protein (TIGR02757 family)
VLSHAAADRLRPRLDAFLVGYDRRSRIPYDPIEFPMRYSDADDIEVAALFSSCLAYGRVDLFKPKLAALFAAMGDRPGAFIRNLRIPRDLAPFRGVVYRFNVGSDLAVLARFASKLMGRYGSIGAAFGSHFRKTRDVREALSGLARELASIDRRPIQRRLGPVRGLQHLFPDPARGGACKRQMLLLRWMVRGPDGLDFGRWRDVPSSALVIPLDTHIARVSRRLGLTRRRTLGWKTAEEITASLRLLDPADPIKYDFALCHYGMSGACPPRLTIENCMRCALSSVCRSGSARVRRATPGASRHLEA